MTIADDILAIKNTVAAIQAAQSTPPAVTVDLSPALSAIGGVQSTVNSTQSTVNSIDAKLTLTPPPA